MSSAYLVLTTTVPNARLSIVPHSPFAEKLLRSQSGAKFPLASFQVRFVLWTIAVVGLNLLGDGLRDALDPTRGDG